MITGRFPDYLQEWYLKNLDSAKEVLNEFELLNALFDEFKGYEKKPYKKVENIVLRSCLPKISGNADYVVTNITIAFQFVPSLIKENRKTMHN